MQESPGAASVRIVYDDGIVRKFVLASVIWGAIGLVVGLLIALQMAFWQLNFDTPWLTFSRLRPLHTNAVIFALVGNMMFAGIYYSTQRLCKTRLASDLLSKIHFWGWQLVILGAALTLPFGITQSKEYAELEWPLDVLVVIVWVAFAVNFFWTLAIRRERNLYVAIWFYIATILAIAILYIVNNLAVPVTLWKSYGIFSGAQDALTQWWYGHNAVAFFLTTPILGIMYYFLPKAANRPVFSYRLSIVHFWALVFIYIWAGPHHLLYTALPDWAQSLGMLFSLMLWAPSWGGMLNGLLTLRGAWDKVRTDPILKFFVAGVTFYGMSTFEGPLLSIKSVNALGHYTDWIIGHAHGGALGWNGLMAAGMFYWLVPRLWGRELHSKRAADAHFWIATLGILIYLVAMWVSGIYNGLAWRATDPSGGLVYSQWGEIVEVTKIMYGFRAFGGALFLTGWLLMFWNLVRTIRAGSPVDGTLQVAAAAPRVEAPGNLRLLFSAPIGACAVIFAALMMIGFGNVHVAMFGIVVLVLGVLWGAFMLRALGRGRGVWHQHLEARSLAFTLLVFFAVAAGGVVELLPGLIVDHRAPRLPDGSRPADPYTALELAGRDIYVREGCYVCHSQMIRPFLAEKKRYGEPSKLGDSYYDRPFQWGSKRTGPDLARVGLKYSEDWHWRHMLDPRSVDRGSNMPRFPWLARNRVDKSLLKAKLRVNRMLGVPYSGAEIRNAVADYERQARRIASRLKEKGIQADPDCELVALIGYLMRLGRASSGRTASVK